MSRIYAGLWLSAYVDGQNFIGRAKKALARVGWGAYKPLHQRGGPRRAAGAAVANAAEWLRNSGFSPLRGGRGTGGESPAFGTAFGRVEPGGVGQGGEDMRRDAQAAARGSGSGFWPGRWNGGRLGIRAHKLRNGLEVVGSFGPGWRRRVSRRRIQPESLILAQNERWRHA